MLSYIWAELERYERLRARLFEAEGTITGDEFARLPGFAPRVWLTQDTVIVLARAANISLPEHRLRLLRGVLRFLLRQTWKDEYLGFFAAKIAKRDFLVEKVRISLILDHGEPHALGFVAVLHDAKLLLASPDEFPLGEDFAAERAIVRATAAYPLR
jgi:hypothetical protein